MAPLLLAPRFLVFQKDKRMAVDCSQVDRTARAAAGAVNIEPWHARNQRRPDCWRPQHAATGGELFVSAIYDGRRLQARRVGGLPLSALGVGCHTSGNFVALPLALVPHTRP